MCHMFRHVHFVCLHPAKKKTENIPSRIHFITILLALKKRIQQQNSVTNAANEQILIISWHLHYTIRNTMVFN